MKPQRRSAGHAAAAPGPRSKIVMIGDRRDWPAEMETILTREGYVTDHVAELHAVVPYLANGAVRALLVVARPLGASDLLIVRQIREASPQTGIVVVTRTPTSPDLKRAFESGATAFLSWPASREALRQALGSGGGT